MFDSQAILKRAEFYRSDMLQFLREICVIPSESCREGDVVQRIKQEMEGVGFDEVMIDGMGNILGRIGEGRRVIAMDGHIDTVGVGDRAAWRWDPYAGKV